MNICIRIDLSIIIYLSIYFSNRRRQPSGSSLTSLGTPSHSPSPTLLPPASPLPSPKLPRQDKNSSNNEVIFMFSLGSGLGCHPTHTPSTNPLAEKPKFKKQLFYLIINIGKNSFHI